MEINNKVKIGEKFICPTCGEETIRKGSRTKRCRHCAELEQIKKREIMTRSRFTIYERDDFKCVYCGSSPIEDGVKLVLDHIIAHRYSEDNSIYNLITACDGCNFHKGERYLTKEVYDRIIKRNIERNKGITPEKIEEINKFMHEYFSAEKRNE